MQLTTITDETRLVVSNIADRATGIVTPRIRLGVTGLARAGKTVFITALVHNLIHGGRLPLFKAYAEGRISGAGLEPQPDDDVPRFDYEKHVRDLVDDRLWPDSTRQISELRLTISFESASFLSRTLRSGRLHLDIVDYPGEWLLDLPLLSKGYEQWSSEAVAAAEAPPRHAHAGDWLRIIGTTDPSSPEDETVAREISALFTDYLRATRLDQRTLSTQPPGRFLMPGDLADSPALTFAPLALVNGNLGPQGSMARMMARRYESYKSLVVRPFFRDHFARLDRQIVLVDALAALNGGPTALNDLANALAAILAAFRIGKRSWFTGLVSRRIDRILFAATKADHLHHGDHDKLEAILARLVAHASERARFARTKVDVLALASVRATREGTLKKGRERLASIVGTPVPGETMDDRSFDGESEIAMFPGDLPEDPESIFEDAVKPKYVEPPLRFLRFRPPKLERTTEGITLSLPHIRLDRALQFLIGDRLA